MTVRALPQQHIQNSCENLTTCMCFGFRFLYMYVFGFRFCIKVYNNQGAPENNTCKTRVQINSTYVSAFVFDKCIWQSVCSSNMYYFGLRVFINVPVYDNTCFVIKMNVRFAFLFAYVGKITKHYVFNKSITFAAEMTHRDTTRWGPLQWQHFRRRVKRQNQRKPGLLSTARQLNWTLYLGILNQIHSEFSHL